MPRRPPPTRVPGRETSAGRRYTAPVPPQAAVDGDPGRFSCASRNFDAQLAELATAQHLVFSLAQLLELGIGEASVWRRARAGRLHRVHQGVYSLVPAPMLTKRGRYLAGTLASTGRHDAHPAALSHRSVADLHGLRVCHRATVEVVVPGRSPHRNPGIQTHRSIRLAPKDIVVVDGIPATTVSRTLLDLASVVGRRALECALDQAEVLRVFDLLELRDQLERNPRHPGTPQLSRSLSEHVAGDTVTDSELEEVMVALLRAHPEIPPALLHGPVDPGDGDPIIHPDLVWPGSRVAAELDGAATHLTRHGFEQDRRRDQRLTRAGWRVVRFTHRQLQHEPVAVAATIRQMLASDDERYAPGWPAISASGSTSGSSPSTVGSRRVPAISSSPSV